MKFFTSQWLSGELTDSAFEAVPDAYCRHLASLRLPPDVLALSEADMHDGLLLDIQHLPESARLRLRLRCGDLQQGYFDLLIEYSGAALADESFAVLRHAMQAPKVEVLYDEVDRVGECFVHRLLLSSSHEVSVTFVAVAIDTHRVSSRAAV
jgi:hypothetical protein